MERILRHNRDVEVAVIGTLLIEPGAYDRVADMLTATCFYDNDTRQVFEAIRRLAEENRPIDMMTVAEQLLAMGTMQQIGGPVFLAEVTRTIASTTHLREHVHILYDHMVARTLATVGNQLYLSATEPAQNVSTLLNTTMEQLENLYMTSVAEHAMHIRPLIDSAIIGIEEAKNRVASGEGAALIGLSSGFPQVDEIIGGWRREYMVILGARPGMGKTAMALTMLHHLAVQDNVPVGFFSIEMSGEDIMRRLLSIDSRVSGTRIMRGTLSDNDMALLYESQQRLDAAPIYIHSEGNLAVSKLERESRAMVRQYGVRCIFIDYIQLMEDPSGNTRNQNRENEVSRISRRVKALAKELQIPIIVLAQVNRNGTMGMEVRPPALSDLRESGALEQDADVVCFIHRPEYYLLQRRHTNEEVALSAHPGETKFIIAKNRNGATDHEVVLRFIPWCTCFTVAPGEWSRTPAERRETEAAMEQTLF